MESELKDNLRTVGGLFCSKTKLAPSTVWARAAKDARFLSRVESGKGFTVKTYDTAIRWFSDNWPADMDWPVGVERPQEAEASTC
jgi:hypothetical protein